MPPLYEGLRHGPETPRYPCLPVDQGPLVLSEDKTELISKQAGLAYPIRDGIPVMLESEARSLNVDERLDK